MSKKPPTEDGPFCTTCSSPMAIGVRSRLVIWQCMNPDCLALLTTDTRVLAPDREPVIGTEKPEGMR